MFNQILFFFYLIKNIEYKFVFKVVKLTSPGWVPGQLGKVPSSFLLKKVIKLSYKNPSLNTK